MNDNNPALAALEKAVQEFANSIMSEPCIVKDAVVVFETTAFNGDGDQGYAVNYAMVTETSMASTVGLLRLGEQYAMRDIFATTGFDDE